MTKDFYFQFEEKFRGDREEIFQRLTTYAPFLETMSQILPAGKCIDLGCGRGEWLQLLTQHGFEASGVDLDTQMIEACQELQLNVKYADALDALSHLESKSQAIVSGFHIAEHLEFDVLRELIAEAHRVLLPGGLLILETPNPENLRVASVNFHLDPTHKKPIPPELLQFLTGYCGFTKSHILRLNHDPEILKTGTVSLQNVLIGASPDYAIIGQKYASKKIIKVIEAVLPKVSGITPEELAHRYEAYQASRFADARSLIESELNRARILEESMQQAEQRVGDAEARVREAETRVALAENRTANATEMAKTASSQARSAETRATNAEQRAISAEAEATSADTRATNAEQRAISAEAKATSADTRATNAEQRAIAAEAQAVDASKSAHLAFQQAELAAAGRSMMESELLAIRHSLSWRLTYPFRFAIDLLLIKPGRAIRHCINWLLFKTINICKKPISGAIGVVIKIPFLFNTASRLVSRFPHLRDHLLEIYLQSSHRRNTEPAQETSNSIDIEGLEMNRKAREVFRELKRLENAEHKHL